MRIDSPPTGAEEVVVPTRGDTSASLYLLLIVAMFGIPIGVSLLSIHSNLSGIVWGIGTSLAGFAALVGSVRITSLRVRMSNRGLIFSRLGKRQEMAWREMQAIEFTTLHERYGNYGVLVSIRGEHHATHFIVDQSAASTVKKCAAASCVHAVVIDNETETIQPPKTGDGDSRRALVRFYARQMVVRKAVSNGIFIVTAFLAAVLLLAYAQFTPAVLMIIALCAIVGISLSIEIYRIAKRLWN